MNESDDDRDYSFEEVARAYHSYFHTHSQQDRWAVEIAIFLPMEHQWSDLWELILAQCATASTEHRSAELAVVSAGPVEDLLCGAGPEFIDRIEREAAVNPVFAVALTGVWPSSIDPAVWARVVAICRSVPEPIDTTYPF